MEESGIESDGWSDVELTPNSELGENQELRFPETHTPLTQNTTSPCLAEHQSLPIIIRKIDILLNSMKFPYLVTSQPTFILKSAVSPGLESINTEVMFDQEFDLGKWKKFVENYDILPGVTDVMKVSPGMKFHFDPSRILVVHKRFIVAWITTSQNWLLIGGMCTVEEEMSMWSRISEIFCSVINETPTRVPGSKYGSISPPLPPSPLIPVFWCKSPLGVEFMVK